MKKRWFSEKDPFSPVSYRYEIDRVLYEGRSGVQEIQVLEHGFFGRMLVLDGVVQLTERDEFFYHETLAHVPLHTHPDPKRVLVIGGGDGGTLREVLRHPGVESATLVDIDPLVTEVSREYFPALAESFSAPRATHVVGDGAEFLATAADRYDVILVDAPDPVGPAKSLSTPEFFESASEALTEGGLLSMQTESLHFHLDFIRRVQELMKNVFTYVDLYAAPIATYAGNWWSFSIASNVPFARAALRDTVPGTRYYGSEVHTRAYVPNGVVERLAHHYEAFEKGLKNSR